MLANYNTNYLMFSCMHSKAMVCPCKDNKKIRIILKKQCFLQADIKDGDMKRMVENVFEKVEKKNSFLVGKIDK